MIIYFANHPFTNTWRQVLKTWCPEIGKILQIWPYEKAAEVQQFPGATYIFSDHERFSSGQRSLVSQLYSQLKQSNTVLNDPSKVLRRYDLLKRLYEDGVNTFRCFRIHELPSDLRFPVFVRIENDHDGARTDLLMTMSDVEREVTRLELSGLSTDDLLVTEFIQSESRDGFYRKYAAFRIGNQIIPRHLVYSKHWMVKVPGVWNNERREEEGKYLESNVFKGELLEIFDKASIEYGRIDFGLVDGKLQVWEINTNPTLMSSKKEIAWARRPSQKQFAQRLHQALMEINQDHAKTTDVELSSFLAR